MKTYSRIFEPFDETDYEVENLCRFENLHAETGAQQNVGYRHRKLAEKALGLPPHGPSPQVPS